MVNAYAKFDQIPLIRSQDIEWHEILTLTKGHNSVVNLQKWMMCNNPKLDLANIMNM